MLFAPVQPGSVVPIISLNVIYLGRVARPGFKMIAVRVGLVEHVVGTKLLKYCSDKLDKVEKKMLVMNEEGGLDEF